MERPKSSATNIKEPLLVGGSRWPPSSHHLMTFFVLDVMEDDMAITITVAVA